MDVPDVSKLQVQDDDGGGDAGGSNQTKVPSIENIQQLLKTKDDTSRFVGLALLKSVLDNSPDLQGNKEVIVSLWDSISPRFLDRLLRTGSQAGSESKNSKDMLDLAVAVVHTFAILLPEDARQDSKLLNRIPRLTKAALHSSKETTKVIIETLLTLITIPDGAKIFANLEVDDWASLIEIAPEHSHVLSIFIWAWEKGTAGLEDQKAKDLMRDKIDGGVQSFVSSFIGTDATSLLEFISHILRNLDESLIPQNPKWIGSVTKLICNLATNRPNAASRSAYINCAGALLLIYPESTIRSLFLDEKDSSKPFSYLFISLILVDLRATLPSLLEKLNDPEYPHISQRLTSALDILTAFIGQLVAWMEELDDPKPVADSVGIWLKISPDLVIKLSRSIAETLSATMEYLRDRWDASIAGAQGLHPEARTGKAHTNSGSHKTLAWDAKDESAATDAFILSAIRAIALWVREDDDDIPREECSGLMDMFIELYQSSGSASSQPKGLDYRLPILAALEGVLRTSKGIDAFNLHNGWTILSPDLLKILEESSTPSVLRRLDFIRGTHIALVLNTVAESEGTTPEDYMNIVTAVAAYNVPSPENANDSTLLEFQADVLQLATTLLENSNPGLRKRYLHSARAVRGIAEQLRSRAEESSDTAKQLEDVLSTLDA
ncbi:DUF1941-domain-containing protein [Annulohypoxylon maeteangense]|uniref:DUF1941-domain-containing protein n=1 Tax=Annulohypoxylon maeteangense TaxID=1927788 RepID=UPI002007A007|nr:DUF1941-domain-containing protein [Annulohypoxylon maeteangense]KAI0887189.1 DUF1941-domain-containing protein [Annulohypoxylon maeteangense]